MLARFFARAERNFLGGGSVAARLISLLDLLSFLLRSVHARGAQDGLRAVCAALHGALRARDGIQGVEAVPEHDRPDAAPGE